MSLATDHETHAALERLHAYFGAAEPTSVPPGQKPEEDFSLHCPTPTVPPETFSLKCPTPTIPPGDKPRSDR